MAVLRQGRRRLWLVVDFRVEGRFLEVGVCLEAEVENSLDLRSCPRLLQ